MLCNLGAQVIALAEYRAQLYDYLKSRMMAIAPNLTVLVGELVGARLIAHAGSLISLAKAPASTVQILGAEKALFRALKTKHEVTHALSAFVSLACPAALFFPHEGTTVRCSARPVQCHPCGAAHWRVVVRTLGSVSQKRFSVHRSGA